MYLPSIAWWRARLAGEAAEPFSPPNATIIRGAWGEQRLTIPIAGGKRMLSRRPRPRLMMSEHGDWRHRHLQAITSAYGALPYFPHFIEGFAQVYRRGGGLPLDEFCSRLEEVFLQCSALEENISYLRGVIKDNSEEGLRLRPDDYDAIPPHISALELLFARGRECVFYLA